MKKMNCPKTKVANYVDQVRSQLGDASWIKAYVAFRAVMHAINDPHAQRNRKQFLDTVDREIGKEMEAKEAVSAVFWVLEDKIRSGEVKDFTPSLSSDIATYWPSNGCT